ncbi:MAG: hypothetical protein LBL74_06530 [Bacteroidales bacterium]|jgi:hypothetical protein|nr:hypothetical protein [Bacteroidales bacterium]
MKKRFIIVCFCTILSLVATAQPIPGTRPGDGGAGTHEETKSPLPTATLLLLGFATLYATKRIRDKRKDE